MSDETNAERDEARRELAEAERTIAELEELVSDWSGTFDVEAEHNLLLGFRAVIARHRARQTETEGDDADR